EHDTAVLDDACARGRRLVVHAAACTTEETPAETEDCDPCRHRRRGTPSRRHDVASRGARGTCSCTRTAVTLLWSPVSASWDAPRAARSRVRASRLSPSAAQVEGAPVPDQAVSSD